MMKIKAITDNPKFHIMPFFYPSLSQKRTRAAFLSVLRMSPVCTKERGAPSNSYLVRGTAKSPFENKNRKYAACELHT